MRVYKFRCCRFGLRAIRERRLKISEIRHLNDPFELLPFDLSDPDLRKAIVNSRNEIGSKRGLICFSERWHNPVLWAHYADSHRGFALGFDLPDGELELGRRVNYVENPIQFRNPPDEEIANDMVFTKYLHWQYEEEIRVWANLEEKSGEHYFHDFDSDMELKEIVVGAGSNVSRKKILQALGPHHEGVNIVKARLAFDAFRVVEDEDGLTDG